MFTSASGHHSLPPGAPPLAANGRLPASRPGDVYPGSGFRAQYLLHFIRRAGLQGTVLGPGPAALWVEYWWDGDDGGTAVERALVALLKRG